MESELSLFWCKMKLKNVCKQGRIAPNVSARVVQDLLIEKLLKSGNLSLPDQNVDHVKILVIVCDDGLDIRSSTNNPLRNLCPLVQ